MAFAYANLAKKYKDFRAPAAEVLVDGEKLDSGKVSIRRVHVEHCAVNTMSNCEIDIAGLYSLKTSRFDMSAVDSVEAGKTLEVKLGYGSDLTTVFYGRVEAVNRQFSMDKEMSPEVTITGLDALRALSGPLQEEAPNMKSAKDFVTGILSVCTSSKAAKSVSVGSVLNFDVSLIKTKETNLRFLKEIGRLSMLSLYTSKGVVYFKDIFSSQTLGISLARGKGLLSFQHETDLDGQVGKVTVTGHDPADNSKVVTGSSDSTSMTGTGKWAGEFLSAAEKKQEHSEEIGVATSESLCARIADSILTWKSLGFVTCKGKCVGLPEVEAGKWMRVEGVDPKVDSAYLIAEAWHDYSESGYLTTFILKGAKTPK
jgi:phage protein D